ncbi:UNVERIFIED_CONTAM: hypothetical protein K2H54_055255 [Gekko kuhli]
MRVKKVNKVKRERKDRPAPLEQQDRRKPSLGPADPLGGQAWMANLVNQELMVHQGIKANQALKEKRGMLGPVCQDSPGFPDHLDHQLHPRDLKGSKWKGLALDLAILTKTLNFQE